MPKSILKRIPGARWVRSFTHWATGLDGQTWCRVVMNRETERLVAGINPTQLKALEISGTAWDRPGMFASYRSVHYPEFDICSHSLDDRFDLIIAEQVFEHLLWPYRAGRNVYQMLKPGGYFLITTPFLIKLHGYPMDCSRWTETGMKYFLAECGFPLDFIRTASWGNRACVIANFEWWVSYRRRLHSLKNEPDVPIVVWALAQKEAA